MSSPILSTFSLKFASALASFALLGMTTHFLGASGRGVISIVVTSIGLVGMVSGFVGGAALVYLLSRNRDRVYASQITAFAYVWALASSAIVTTGIHLLGSVGLDYSIHSFFLGGLASMIAINSVIVLSAGNLFLYNAVNLIQSASCLVFFFATSVGEGGTSVRMYVFSLYGAYIVCFALTSAKVLIFLRGLRETDAKPRLLSTLGTLLKFGGLAQLSNLLLYISYRLSYYVLGLHSGPSMVGIFSVAMIISESLWMISGSFAIVLYAAAARESNSAELVSRTLNYVKICGIVSLFAVGTLICTPSSVFAAIFGAEFGEVKNTIAALSIAMVSTSVSTIINHYFAGLGLYATNAKVAFVGFLVSVAGNLLLVPTFGLIGAGLTASAANLLVAVWLVHVFMHHNGLKLRAFALHGIDIQALASLVGRR